MSTSAQGERVGIYWRLRGVAKAIRYLPDRLLHARRRDRARHALSTGASFDSVVFICYGNVCRSPFAKVVFERLIASARRAMHVTSAGFVGPNRESPDGAIAAARRRGFDLTDHRSQLITSDTIKPNRLYVVVSKEQETSLVRQFAAPRSSVLVLGDLDPEEVDRRTILDPWGGNGAAFDASYDRITRCIRELVAVLNDQPNAPAKATTRR